MPAKELFSNAKVVGSFLMALAVGGFISSLLLTIPGAPGVHLPGIYSVRLELSKETISQREQTNTASQPSANEIKINWNSYCARQGSDWACHNSSLPFVYDVYNEFDLDRDCSKDHVSKFNYYSRAAKAIYFAASFTFVFELVSVLYFFFTNIPNDPMFGWWQVTLGIVNIDLSWNALTSTIQMQGRMKNIMECYPNSVTVHGMSGGAIACSVVMIVASASALITYCALWAMRSKKLKARIMDFYLPSKQRETDELHKLSTGQVKGSYIVDHETGETHISSNDTTPVSSDNRPTAV